MEQNLILGYIKYQGDNYSPKGHKYIREFNCDKVPTTLYRVGGVILKKEVVFNIMRQDSYSLHFG